MGLYANIYEAVCLVHKGAEGVAFGKLSQCLGASLKLKIEKIYIYKNMKKIILYVSLTMVLVACGDRSKIETAVRENLKDPKSAQFKDSILSSTGNFSCSIWNAKNSMGGYGDWSFAELKKNNSEWVVMKMQGEQDNCTADALEQKEKTLNISELMKDINRSNQPQ